MWTKAGSGNKAKIELNNFGHKVNGIRIEGVQHFKTFRVIRLTKTTFYQLNVPIMIRFHGMRYLVQLRESSSLTDYSFDWTHSIFPEEPDRNHRD